MAAFKCQVCGGTTSSYPSEAKKHEATLKHQTALPADAPTSEAILLPGEVTPKEVQRAKAAAGAIQIQKSLDALIQDKAEELARRQADLKWREKHQAEKAKDYRAAKVTPLFDEIETLRKARNLLGLI